MKKPTLEEVVEKFKNAKIVKSMICKKKHKINTESIYESQDIFFAIDKNDYKFAIWDESLGYAKILTYKNKSHILTESFIKENQNKKLKEVFPDVCNVLEVWRIYKNKTEKGCTYAMFNGFNSKNYGFDHYGDFVTDAQWFDDDVFEENFGKNGCLLEPAATEEWVSAIKKECEKRRLDLEKGNFKCLIDSYPGIKYNPEYNEEKDRLWTSHGVIYEKGVFAEPIPTYTQKEAEEKFSIKII